MMFLDVYKRQRLCHVLAKCGLIKDPKTMEVLNWLDWYTSDTTGAHMGIACDDGPNACLLYTSRCV